MREEVENISAATAADDKQVVRMLAGLKRVEAPKDFEFRLKARIANARPQLSRRANYKRRFAFALPASAFALITAFVAINGNFFRPSQTETPIAQSNLIPVITPAPQSENAPNSAAVAASDAFAEQHSNPSPPQMATAAAGTVQRKIPASVYGSTRPSPADNRAAIRRNSVKSEAGFSTDQAVKPPPVFVQPEFGNAPQNNSNPQFVNEPKKLSARESVSSGLGVELEVGDGGAWTVKSVKPNSAAERAGVKANDVIETLDGQKISGDQPVPPGKKLSVKKIGVKRGAAQVEINLQGNPK